MRQALELRRRRARLLTSRQRNSRKSVSSQDGVKRAKVLPSGRKMMDIDKVRPEEEAFLEPDVAPKSALVDALQQLQGATQTGAIDARDRLLDSTRRC